MIKILYIVPGTLAQSEQGAEELSRRKKILQSHAQKGTIVEIKDLGSGPSSIESAYEEYLSVPGSVERAIQAEKDGYEGIILGCFGDPGLDALREMVRIPVVGPGETAMHIASLLGRKFSIVTVLDSVVPSLKKLARMVGLDKRLASVRAVNIPVLELRQNVEATTSRMREESQKAIDEDSADVIAIGCMSMAFMGVSETMQKSLGIPVVNPALVSLTVLEGLVHADLSQSKKAYPFPTRKA
ncbi:MAG: hydrogenase expression protein HupH [Candidatus Aminicenantes bacterium]|nr:MAG: hydrogenase expression protein HupH [Candidatus Aminicenantes bacterium]